MFKLTNVLKKTYYKVCRYINFEYQSHKKFKFWKCMYWLPVDNSYLISWWYPLGDDKIFVSLLLRGLLTKYIKVAHGGRGRGPLLAPDGDCGAAEGPPWWWSGWRWPGSCHGDSSYDDPWHVLGRNSSVRKHGGSVRSKQMCLGGGWYRNFRQNPLPVCHDDDRTLWTLVGSGEDWTKTWHDSWPADPHRCQELIILDTWVNTHDIRNNNKIQEIFVKYIKIWWVTIDDISN